MKLKKLPQELKIPSPFTIINNLERIAEEEGHQRQLIFDTSSNKAWKIIEDIQKARRENSDAYWETIRI